MSDPDETEAFWTRVRSGAPLSLGDAVRLLGSIHVTSQILREAEVIVTGRIEALEADNAWCKASIEELARKLLPPPEAAPEPAVASGPCPRCNARDYVVADLESMRCTKCPACHGTGAAAEPTVKRCHSPHAHAESCTCALKTAAEAKAQPPAESDLAASERIVQETIDSAQRWCAERDAVLTEAMRAFEAAEKAERERDAAQAEADRLRNTAILMMQMRDAARTDCAAKDERICLLEAELKGSAGD